MENAISFGDVLDSVDRLSLDEHEALLDIVRIDWQTRPKAVSSRYSGAS